MSNLYLDGSFEDAYYDVKFVFDSITDDDTFQTADSGIVFSYLDRIVEALERQVPTTPVKKSFIIPHEGINVCPNCKIPLPNKSHHYCSNCGQKLDWGDE